MDELKPTTVRKVIIIPNKREKQQSIIEELIRMRRGFSSEFRLKQGTGKDQKETR